MQNTYENVPQKFKYMVYYFINNPIIFTEHHNKNFGGGNTKYYE